MSTTGSKPVTRTFVCLYCDKPYTTKLWLDSPPNVGLFRCCPYCWVMCIGDQIRQAGY